MGTQNRLIRIFGNIKQRCYNPKSIVYTYYGGRGIKVCDKWLLGGSKAFIEWALANGYQDDLTIDRIDNNGNYCPENCRWVTKKEQSNNKRNNTLITIDGITKTLAQWSDYSGIDNRRILLNIKKGYKNKQILTPEKYKKEKSKIAQYDLNGNIIKIWNSPLQIENELKIKRSKVIDVCRKKYGHVTAYGYGWAYYPNDTWKPKK